MISFVRQCIGLKLIRKMKILSISKDGGKESTCWGYWLIEIKALFSIVLLQFVGASRECYHSHAFNSISWLLKGELTEYFQDGSSKVYKPSILPIITKREPQHKVSSKETSWVISFRGPWKNVWKETTAQEGQYLLTHGRKRVNS